MREATGDKARLNHIRDMMIGMRNILIHQYFAIDEIILWQTIEQDLPVLEKQVNNILKKLE